MMEGMAQQRPSSVRDDLEELVNMFLTHPDLGFGSPTSHGGDVADGIPEVETNREKRQVVAHGEDVADGIPEVETDREKRQAFLKRCGASLAHMGDELLKHHKPQPSTEVNEQPGLVEVIVKMVSDLEDKTDTASEQRKEDAWQLFKQIIDNSLTELKADDVYKSVAAVLVTIRGLSSLGKVGTMVVRRFSLRYFEERDLANIIERLGGLNPIVHEDLD